MIIEDRVESGSGGVCVGGLRAKKREGGALKEKKIGMLKRSENMGLLQWLFILLGLLDFLDLRQSRKQQ